MKSEQKLGKQKVKLALALALGALISGVSSAQADDKGQSVRVDKGQSAAEKDVQVRIQIGTPIYRGPVYTAPVYAPPVYAPPVHARPVYSAPAYPVPVAVTPVQVYETHHGHGHGRHKPHHRHHRHHGHSGANYGHGYAPAQYWVPAHQVWRGSGWVTISGFYTTNYVRAIPAPVYEPQPSHVAPGWLWVRGHWRWGSVDWVWSPGAWVRF
jgi:hypothetical protein